jgi:hypothetical protein
MEPNEVGLGTSLDMVKVREQLDRHLTKRGKLLERFEKLALVGDTRSESKRVDAWNHRALPSDPPSVQMLMYLAEELETGDWRKIEDDFKRTQMKNQLMKQMGDLVDSLEEKSAATFKEYCTLIDQHMRKTEHKDKMAIASNRKDEDGSDAELIAKATALGITLNGDAS